MLLPHNITSALQPMEQHIIQYVKSKYPRELLEKMLLCFKVGEQYEVDFLSTVHIIAHVWKNTPTHTIANCFRHSNFVSPEPEDAAVAEEVSSNNDCLSFNNFLPNDATFADHIGIEYGVTTAGRLTNEEIINEVTCSQDDHDEERPCEEEQPRPRRTSRAEALFKMFVSALPTAC